MKKIVVISNMYPSHEDPVYGTFVRDFVTGIGAAFPQSRVEKVVIPGRSKNACEKIRKYTVFYLSILYRLFTRRYDLVYVHIITHAALPLRLVALFRNLPLVFNVHGEDLLTQSPLAAWFLKLAVPLLQQSRLIVLPSEYFKKRFHEQLPEIPTAKLFVSPSGGVDMQLFSNKGRMPSPEYTVGYVSRIDRGKGWDTFLEAISLLKEQACPVRALVIGRGAEEPQFRNAVADLELESLVDYRGAVAHEKLPEYYSQMDLFVFPTKLEESLGLVGLEAMACGIPVAGSQIGGLTDYIEEGVNGFFFTPGDSEALANKIKYHYQGNRQRRETYSRNAVLTARRFSWQDTFEQLAERLSAL